MLDKFKKKKKKHLRISKLISFLENYPFNLFKGAQFRPNLKALETT